MVVARISGVVEERRPDGSVMWSRMMLGKIVGMIETTFFPVDFELFLADAVAHPVKAHVHGFGAALLDGISADTHSGAVVSHDRGSWLWMAHFFKAGADGTCFTAVVVEAGGFGFSGTGDDNVEDVTDDRHGPIGWNVRCLVAICGLGGRVWSKVVIPGNSGASFGFALIGGIRFDMEYHVTGSIPNHGVWVGGTVIQ